MDCASVRECLSRYIDGDLTVIERRDVELHLDKCEACGNERDDLLAVRENMKSMLTPPAVSAREWQDLVLRSVSRHSERFGWVLLAPAVFALIAFGIVAFFTDPTISIWIRLASAGIAAGLTFLILSAMAERWRARRFERYERVER